MSAISTLISPIAYCVGRMSNGVCICRIEPECQVSHLQGQIGIRTPGGHIGIRVVIHGNGGLGGTIKGEQITVGGGGCTGHITCIARGNRRGLQLGTSGEGDRITPD